MYNNVSSVNRLNNEIYMNSTFFAVKVYNLQTDSEKKTNFWK